jgi:hypothetical protein
LEYLCNHATGNALLFAFVDSSHYGERIYEREDIETLADFCRKYTGSWLCFIIDQILWTRSRKDLARSQSPAQQNLVQQGRALLVCMLRKVFLGSEWFMALKAFKNIPSVIGRIAASGLHWDDKSIPAAPIISFPNNIVPLSKERPSTYFEVQLQGDRYPLC